MTEFHEKFIAFFFGVLLLGGGFLMYKSQVDKVDCTKEAMSQNRSVEDIKILCR